MRKRTESELRQFYEQWGPFVTTFCKLYLGDSQVTETVVAQAFLKYFRSELPLRRDHVPTALIALALEESNCGGEGGGTDADSAFEWAVLELPPDERAVFILHGVLDLQLPWVAAVTGIPFATVSQLWIRALIQLRMSTVDDGCSRLFAGCVPAPQPVPGACA
jgi:DNA-directed RNA polymerase specialized sigma24 family protein